MIVKRIEPWGTIRYDTIAHRFLLDVATQSLDSPNPTEPILLNIDLTLRCNMDCHHCVAADMVKEVGSFDAGELVLSDQLFEAIKSSPFLVVVLTGGEPFLPSQAERLEALIKGIKNKGIIVDTNGTDIPSSKMLRVLKKRGTLVRVSWDTPVPAEEVKLRKYPKGMYSTDLEAIRAKENFIDTLVQNDILVAVQTVIHKGNYQSKSLEILPEKLHAMGVNRWVLQRFIPSHRKLVGSSLQAKQALSAMENLSKRAERVGVECDFKADLRHNSVFLLVGDGDLYTQSNKEPGKKIKIGKIGETRYFAWVSQTDHADRYLRGARGKGG